MIINLRCNVPHDRRGAAAVELALLVPALLLALGLLVSGGRLWFARTTVNEAAQSAARAASLWLDRRPQRSAAGRAAGPRSLATAWTRCWSISISIDTAAFAVPVGTPSTVTSRILCKVDFSGDLPCRLAVPSSSPSGSAALEHLLRRRNSIFQGQKIARARTRGAASGVERSGDRGFANLLARILPGAGTRSECSSVDVASGGVDREAEQVGDGSNVSAGGVDLAGMQSSRSCRAVRPSPIPKRNR